MTREERIQYLKTMNDIIIDNGDEDIWETWIMLGVPDCPSEYDYEDIADDEECFYEICNLFERLKKHF
jgi:hypothetical protein